MKEQVEMSGNVHKKYKRVCVCVLMLMLMCWCMRGCMCVLEEDNSVCVCVCVRALTQVYPRAGESNPPFSAENDKKHDRWLNRIKRERSKT